MIRSNERHRGALHNTLVDWLKRLRLAHRLIHALASPRRITHNGGPIVVVLAGSSDVHHIVYSRTPTQCFSSDDMVHFIFVVFLITYQLLFDCPGD